MRGLAFLFLPLLASCGAEVRDMPLTGIDFGDARVVQSISAQLTPGEAVAFTSFAVRHHIASGGYCGQPLTGEEGKPPPTVGAAIKLTLLRDEEERRAAKEARKPQGRRELAQQNWDELIRRKDLLIDAQTILRSEHGRGVDGRPEWASLEAQIADLDRRLTGLKSAIHGSAGD